MNSCSQLHSDVDHDPHGRAQKATAAVLALTVVTMIAEIIAGWWTGSMALLADGSHMAMHAAAMGVAVFAYRFARRHRSSELYSFGAGKAADLGGFANAVMLGVVALLVAGESVERLVSPGPVDFAAALWVAAVGLGVNLLSAWLLRGEAHDQGGVEHAHDHNREAAFVHVLADAVTSGLAIVALYCGKRFGLTWLDPPVGLVGAAVIARWSLALVRRTGRVLLDATPGGETARRIRDIAADHGDEVHDLHVWPIAAGRYAVALSASPRGRDAYRATILALPGVAHLTIDRSAADVGGTAGGSCHHPGARHHHHH